MKLPSLQHAIREAMASLKRFPLVILTAILGASAAILLLERNTSATASPLFNVLFAAMLGLPWLLGLALLAERKNGRRPGILALQAGGILLLIGYACSLPSFPDEPIYPLVRLVMLVVVMILFTCLSPYLRKNEVNGFWQFNRRLWFRLVITAFYAAVLFIGLSIGMVAVEQLFGFDIPLRRYQELWVVIAGLFSPWFFLAGLPQQWPELEQDSEYPAGLKIFAQYIVTPLVALYLIILYVYVLKIILVWDWPKGLVSKLILGFSGSGIFALLLLYPIKEQAENRWIEIAWKWFFIVLIPLLIMLPLAVWRRVEQYGITEGRYLALLLFAVLTILVVYFIFSRKKSIKMIPMTCALALLLACFGPWSIFNISEKSQIGRLQQLAIKTEILIQGAIHPAGRDIPPEDAREIRSIVSYLRNMHGYDGIRSWFQVDLQHQSAGITKLMSTDSVVQLMGISKHSGKGMQADGTILLQAKFQNGFMVAGYDRLFTNQYFTSGQQIIWHEDQPFFCTLDRDLQKMQCYARAGDRIIDSVAINLEHLFQSAYQSHMKTNMEAIPLEDLTAQAGGARLKVKLYVIQTQLTRREGVLKAEHSTMNILYRLD